MPGPLGQSYPPLDSVPAIPWSTGPVPALSTLDTPTVTPSRAQKSTRSKSRGRSDVTKSSKTSKTTSSTAPQATTRTAPPTPRLVMDPVTPHGVPGSSRVGLDLVSYCCTTFIYTILIPFLSNNFRLWSLLPNLTLWITL